MGVLIQEGKRWPDRAEGDVMHWCRAGECECSRGGGGEAAL